MTARQRAAAVKRGAKLLDKHYPDWFKRVRRSRLDMRRASCRIVGQVAPTYRDGLATLGIHIHSFYEQEGHGFVAADYEYETLADAWWQTIRERRAAAKAAP